jgi:hypothetical protein
VRYHLIKHWCELLLVFFSARLEPAFVPALRAADMDVLSVKEKPLSKYLESGFAVE